jgi:hypothetical protein
MQRSLYSSHYTRFLIDFYSFYSPSPETLSKRRRAIYGTKMQSHAEAAEANSILRGVQVFPHDTCWHIPTSRLRHACGCFANLCLLTGDVTFTTLVKKGRGGGWVSGSHGQQSPKNRKVGIKLHTLSEKIWFSTLNSFSVVEKSNQELQ